MAIVLATTNPGKIEEIRELLRDLPVGVLSLSDFPEIPEIPETGVTMAENAKMKAQSACAATGRIALADDSGLEVDALEGGPGVYSNRFAGPDATDADKCAKILSLLNGVPDERRTARFRAAVAICTPKGELHVVQGTCEGRIAHAPKGSGGFGYDPIFYLPEIGKTMAELSREEKNAISHRGQALRAAKEILLRLVEHSI